MSPLTKFQDLKIPLEAIKSATNDFSDANRIGVGGFGKVYRGEVVLSNDKIKTIVALKRLDPNSKQGNSEFLTEIMMLFSCTHENIVSLLGYCDDHGEKILMYEYASKGSLDTYLASDNLKWVQRLKICIGAARGLAHIHSPSWTRQRIIHRDIKSSNILLDDNWNAKISDFGLSKFVQANSECSFTVTNPAGTLGYVDPQYHHTFILTKESDVYSFGVVLFEVLCGVKQNFRPLVALVQEYYQKKTISELVYSNIKDEIKKPSLELFTQIAYQCLNKEREERPLMSQIVRALERALDLQVNADEVFHINQHLRIELEAIQSATNFFSDDHCIGGGGGGGGFGKLYKGELVLHVKGKTMVVLKRLNRAIVKDEFWREIMMFSNCTHENIISLLGYCDDDGEKIIVYEYASKKSLDTNLASDDLTWIQRLKICIGTAHGLAYLHTCGESQPRIHHRHIKSSNILLDDNWNAKISDFGLSKFDPLYHQTWQLTTESDVYSFGVVLFEVLCGRVDYDNQNLTRQVQEYYEQKRISELVHSNIKDEISTSCLNLFADIAYQCLKTKPEERPLMAQVVNALERALDIQVKADAKADGILTVNVKNLDSKSDSNHYLVIYVDEVDPMHNIKRTVKYDKVNGEWNEVTLYVENWYDQTLWIDVIDIVSVTKHSWLGNAMVKLVDLTPDIPQTYHRQVKNEIGYNCNLLVEVVYKQTNIEDLISPVRKAPIGTPRRGGLLSISIHSAQLHNVKQPDSWVLVLFRGELSKTQSVMNTNHPMWLQEFKFMLQQPPMDEILHIEVINNYSWSGLIPRKESLGCIDISLEDVVNKRWTNKLYHVKPKHDLESNRYIFLRVELHWRTSD